MLASGIYRVCIITSGILLVLSPIGAAQETECEVAGLLLPAVQITGVSNIGEQVEVRIDNIQGEGTLRNCNGPNAPDVSAQRISVEIDLLMRVPRRDLGKSSGITPRGQATIQLRLPDVGEGRVSSDLESIGGRATCVTRARMKNCEFRIDFPFSGEPEPNSNVPIALALESEFEFTFQSTDPSKDWSLQEIKVRNAFVALLPSEGLFGDSPGGSPGSGASALRDFDSDSNCRLGDTEFFDAVDRWIGQLIDNSLFFSAVDAWIGNLDICGVAATAQPKSTEKLSEGAVEVFDITGRLVFRGRSAGSDGLRHLRDLLRVRVANGVYFARFASSAEVRMFVVMR